MIDINNNTILDESRLVKTAYTNWGTQVSLSSTNGNLFLVMINWSKTFQVWFASTNDVDVLDINTNKTSGGVGQTSLSGYTFIRENSKLTVKTPSNASIKIIS